MIFAVSGVKNSGKTTLIEKLIKELGSRGLKTAVIKHDGHDFEMDVPGTDSWRFQKAGAYGTAVFSDNRVLIAKKQQGVTAENLMQAFPDADVIILEGFKYSHFPNIEIIRSGNSSRPVCSLVNLRALVTDLDRELFPAQYRDVPAFGLEDISELLEFLVNQNNER